MSYIIVQPNSNTNPSSKYLVADHRAANATITGSTGHYQSESFDTYAEAKAWRDTLNEQVDER